MRPSPTHALPSIDDAEFAHRAARLQALIAEQELDILVVNASESDSANVRYLSDYWPAFEFAGVAVPASGSPTLLIGPESEAYAKDRSRIKRIRKLAEYRESSDPDYPTIDVATYSSVFEEAGVTNVRRIGLAGSFATNFLMLESLRSSFPDALFVPADSLLTRLRAIKSEAELACMRAAFGISEEAIDRILVELRPGMSELQAVGIALEALYERGAESEAFPQYVFSGPNTRHAISRATHRTLQRGEVIQLNIGARVAGYSSAVGRIVSFGRLRAGQRDVLEFGLEAHQATLAWLRAGANASQIAHSYRAFFRDHGRSDLYLYGPCHGIGLMEGEPPWMEETSDYPLQENMTFQIDTFVMNSEFGARWENGVRIGTDGGELLSGRRMELVEL